MAGSAENTRDPLIRAFGNILRSYRKAAGLSRARLAEALGCTEGWIEQMETGTKPSVASAMDLDHYFGIRERVFQHMAEEIENAGIHAAPPPGFEEFTRRERKANQIHHFGALLIHGLVQTPAYAEAILASHLPPRAVEHALAVRMERRREVLERDNPPRLWLTFDEWVLRRTVGGPEVMYEQLADLLQVAENPLNTIQILPHNTTHYVAYSGTFTVLGFEDAPSLGYIEAGGQGMLIQDSHAVAGYAVRYASLQGHAYNVDESRKVIKEVMDNLKP